MGLLLAEAIARAIGRAYLQTAWVKHPEMNSAHDCAAIRKEKYDILWEEVSRLDAERMRSGGGQVGSDSPPPRDRHLLSNRVYR